MASLQSTERWFFIVNPVAGNGKARQKWLKYLPLLERELGELDWVYTKRKGHAITLAQEAIRQGYQKIVAVGGDGTNNEVINGIFQQGEKRKALLYTLLPVGTGNDWIRTHHIPRKIERWIAMVKRGHTISHDVGVVYYQRDGIPCKRFFINIAGLAYDAYVVRFTGKYRSWVASKFFYLLLTLVLLFAYRFSKARVVTDQQTTEGMFYTINVGICRHSGGGMQLVPHAVPDSGTFALTLARKMSRLSVLLNTPRFYNGRIGAHPKVTLSHSTELQVETTAGPPLMVEVDGEWLGYTPATFIILKGALKVIVDGAREVT